MYLFLIVKEPYSKHSLLQTNVFEILKKQNMESSSHNALIKITEITKKKKIPQVLRHCVRLIYHDLREEQDCSSVQNVEMTSVPWEMVFHNRLH